jgi:hypothetical protein
VASKSLPCGLVIGKSLRCLAIVVENLFRPYNGGIVWHPRKPKS